MRFIRRDEDGTYNFKDDGLAELKDVEQIICFNPTEKNIKKNNFFCCVCNKELIGLPRCDDHWNSHKHMDKVEERFKRKKHLSTIKLLAPNHEEKLTNFLQKSLVDLALLPEELVERQVVCDRVSKILTDKLSNGITSRLCGSSLTGIGFIDAGIDINVNFDLKVLGEKHPHITDTSSFLISIFGILKNNKNITDLEEFFYCKYPKITFKDKESGLDCCISTVFYNGYFTSELILKYLAIDERTKELCLLFKHWGQICKLDDQDKGSIPSIAFSLMVIHYLQQQQPPVLPVIHHPNSVAPVLGHGYVDQEMESKHGVTMEESVHWKSENKDSLGKLFIGLFRYYLVDFHTKTMVATIRQISPLSRLHRMFGSKKIAVEDPFIMRESVTNIMTSQAVMTYFLDCMELSYKHYSGVSTFKKKAKSPVKKLEDKQSKAEKDTKVDIAQEKETEKGSKEKNEHVTKELESENVNVKQSDLVEFSSSEDSDVIIEPDSDDESDDVSINQHNHRNESESDQQASKKIVINEIDSTSKVTSDNAIETNKEESISEVISENNKEEIKVQELKKDIKVEEKSVVDINKVVSTGDTDNKSSSIELVVVKDTSVEVNVNKDAAVVTNVNKEDINTNTEENVVQDNVIADKKDQIEDISEGFEEISITELNDFVDKKLNSQENTLSSQLESSDLKINEKLQELSIGNQKNVNTESVNESTNEVTKDSTNQETGEQGLANHMTDQDSAKQDKGDQVLTDQMTADKDLTNQVTADKDLTNQVTADKDLTNQVTADKDLTNQVTADKDSTNQVTADKDLTNQVTADKDLTNQEAGDHDRTNQISGDEPINFSFSFKTLTPPYKIPLVCLSCTNEGHHHSQCPQKIVSFKPLKETTKEFVSIVTAVCEYVVRENELQTEEFDMRLKVLKFLEDHLKETFRSKCRLALFGSSVNGFGFTKSDMDICLRFNSDIPPDNIDYSDMVKTIAKALSKHVLIRNVMYIASAKVPIVKFEVPTLNREGKTVRRLEGDISLYNSLALRNSQLLATYAGIDPRVRVIGYCIKVFAKLCEIGDASRGSLSSYAYILLVLHYLQHTKPPVIPVLQDIYDKSQKKPQVIVEEWNSYFYDDIASIPKVWKGYGKNKQSVGELWIGFFRYYIETFNFHKDVVVINRSNKLSKFQKGWNRVMAIEDPFNLKHNLGAGITGNMLEYIIGCFKQARLRFGEPSTKLKPTDNLMTYFFDVKVLTSNKSVPKDRLCRRCNKIGHTAAKCAEQAAQKRERRRRDSEREESEKQHTPMKSRNTPSQSRDTPNKSRDTPNKSRDTPNKSRDTPIKSRDKRNSQSDDKALRQQESSNNHNDSTKDKSINLDIKCFRCHRKGHVKRDCPKTQQQQNRRGGEVQDNGFRDSPQRKDVNRSENHDNHVQTKAGRSNSYNQKNQSSSPVSSHMRNNDSSTAQNQNKNTPNKNRRQQNQTPGNQEPRSPLSNQLSSPVNISPSMYQMDENLRGYQFNQNAVNVHNINSMFAGSPSNVSFLHGSSSHGIKHGNPPPLMRGPPPGFTDKGKGGSNSANKKDKTKAQYFDCDSFFNQVLANSPNKPSHENDAHKTTPSHHKSNRKAPKASSSAYQFNESPSPNTKKRQQNFDKSQHGAHAQTTPFQEENHHVNRSPAKKSNNPVSDVDRASNSPSTREKPFSKNYYRNSPKSK